jgi:hypothetical protein
VPRSLPFFGKGRAQQPQPWPSYGFQRVALAALRRAVREFIAWPFDLYAARVDPPSPLLDESRAMERRRPSREPEMPSLCAICAVVFSGKLIRTLFLIDALCLDHTLAFQPAWVGGSAKTKGDLTVAFHAPAGQSAQVRTFNCSLSRTEPSVKGKRTFVMRGCGPGEIRTHDLRSANLVLYPAELRGRCLFRPAGIKRFRYPCAPNPPQIPQESRKVGIRCM